MAARNGGLPGADENVMPGIDEIFGQASALEIGLIAAGAVLALAVAAFFIITMWHMQRHQQSERDDRGEQPERDVEDQPDRDAKT